VRALARMTWLKHSPSLAAARLAVLLLCVPSIVTGADLPPQTGLASVYSEELDGRRTASGERYDGSALTAAHRTLPIGTEVRVTRLDNGKSVRVRINDRGPQVKDRIIDLSRSAAAALGMRSGVTRVKVEVVGRPRASTVASPRP
jgi:rare lipoprotein A